MKNSTRLARKSHKPKRLRDLRAVKPLGKRLGGTVGLKCGANTLWRRFQGL